MSIFNRTLSKLENALAVAELDLRDMLIARHGLPDAAGDEVAA